MHTAIYVYLNQIGNARKCSDLLFVGRIVYRRLSILYSTYYIGYANLFRIGCPPLGRWTLSSTWSLDPAPWSLVPAPPSVTYACSLVAGFCPMSRWFLPFSESLVPALNMVADPCSLGLYPLPPRSLVRAPSVAILCPPLGRCPSPLGLYPLPPRSLVRAPSVAISCPPLGRCPSPLGRYPLPLRSLVPALSVAAPVPSVAGSCPLSGRVI